MIKAQKKWAKGKVPEQRYQAGDQVWLEGRNLRIDRPSAKLAPKRHGPFKITKVLSPITYQLELPPQWKIHDVFHADLLTPYREKRSSMDLTLRNHLLTLSMGKKNMKSKKFYNQDGMDGGARFNT